MYDAEVDHYFYSFGCWLTDLLILWEENDGKMKSVKLCQIVISKSIPIRVPKFQVCSDLVLFMQLLALLLIFNANEINIPWYLLRSACALMPRTWGPDASRFARKKKQNVRRVKDRVSSTFPWSLLGRMRNLWRGRPKFSLCNKKTTWSY